MDWRFVVVGRSRVAKSAVPSRRRDQPMFYEEFGMNAPGHVRRAAIAVALGMLLALSPSSVACATEGPTRSLSSLLLVPRVKPGERIDTIFSKTVSLSIPGFDPKVSRTSGTDTIVIRSAGPDSIVADESYHYDGTAAGSDVVEVRDAGRTNCVNGKCRTNDQTSAPLFNPLLWGAIPHRLSIGQHWTASIAQPWEIGPSGTEVVAVARLDPGLGLVTLTRQGAGAGLTSDDARMATLTISAGGRAIKVRVVPGQARWTGSATVVRGITLADQIVVERTLDLVTDDGKHIAATQRTYTIFVRAEDAATGR
ncbi:hypothetical protein ABDK56_09920 [Sphingomonas sp. ASV193]|uniref:hypothetical protein n=1 Tax=Sphingomonas sp. ASV193 TaxID=3144405 RepID=UPI0032E9092C